MKYIICTVSLALAFSVSASDIPIFASLSDDMAQTALLATQTNQNVDYQPFILSVYHSEDLSKFGVRTLGEALTLVPGVDMATNTMNNRTPIFRGSNPTAYGQSTLVIDGFVVNDSIFSNYNSYLDLPIELIDRIEVVRGSGSFIEGVNGYAGTINVITHAGSDPLRVENGTLFASGGSEGAMGVGGWSRYKGETWKLSLDAFTQRHDRQTPIGVTDSLGKSGYAKLGMEHSGFGIAYTYGGFELRGRYNDYQSDSAFGNLNALPNADGMLQQPSWYIQGKQTFSLARDLNLILKASMMEDSWQSDSQALPIGTYGAVTFSDGYWASLMIKNRRTSGRATLHYNGLELHRLSAGVESTWDEAIDMHSITTNKDTGVGMVDYSNTSRAFIDAANAKRQGTNLYLSDNITVNDKTAIALTLGMMKTSDIESHAYWRTALVYQPTRSDIFKLMAASGVRHPSFQEMYVTPSLYATGNSNLSYEHVRSLEAQYLRKLHSNLTAGINLFYLANSQQITRDATGIFQNYGENIVKGGEVELRGKFSSDDTVLLSYSYFNGSGKIPGSNEISMPFTASNLIKAAYAYDLTENWTLGGIWNYVGSKKRFFNDTRDSLAAYNTLDIALGWDMNTHKGWYAQGVVKNVADTTVRYPSPASTYPDDYPVAGRSFWIRTGWKF
ncbi:MAG: TonB-dependent receptor plug domain-containing protein [Sulfuricurvum sp.]|nr:TonB-dependent receptor plug domain-containing protein [Sulfuricurvum sp.]